MEVKTRRATTSCRCRKVYKLKDIDRDFTLNTAEEKKKIQIFVKVAERQKFKAAKPRLIAKFGILRN